MFNKEVYIARRQKLKRQLGKGLLLFLGNEESSMNYKDNWYHFRQDSNFLYFFGLDKAGLAAVIDIEADKDMVFGRELTLDEIVWMGPQSSIIDQAAQVGIEDVRPPAALAGVLSAARSSGLPIHFLPPYRPENIQKLSELLGLSLAAIKGQASVAFIKAVVEQRSIKSAEEIVQIEEAVNITAAMHLAAIKGARDGMTEAQLAGELPGIAIGAGGNLSFPTILTVNGQVLHNHYSNTVMKEGQLALCDAGAENKMHYAGDMTRTFPVGRRFTGIQKEMYEIVLSAQEAAIAALRPGILFRDVHLLAAEKLVEGLKALGVMKGDVKEAVAAGAHTMVFQCGLGHMMGLDVHDMEDLGEPYVGYTEELKKSTEFGLKSLRLGRALEPGFVVTIEPGLYFIPELMDLRKSEKKFFEFINYDKLEGFRGFGGIRIEEDMLITETGSKLLGKPLIKRVEEIEAARS
ncbi:MAG: Xaa-Pro aminopeptidase [Sphingobacteriales bacterium 50-39]|nr:aminopeptidase P family protein [Sphingobacteriales bacterium]OJW54255.1 MAG: Xaa-Pro aminopeptidase [Sphingobacteriales bacterium 50-39]